MSFRQDALNCLFIHQLDTKRALRQQGFSAQVCTVLTVIDAASTSLARYPFAILSISKEYCRQGAVYSVCSIKHKINATRLGGVFVFALFTLLSFFSVHYRQDFVNSLLTIVNIL